VNASTLRPSLSFGGKNYQRQLLHRWLRPQQAAQGETVNFGKLDIQHYQIACLLFAADAAQPARPVHRSLW